MKQIKKLKWLLFIVIVAISTPLIIAEQFYKTVVVLPKKLRLNYQQLLFIKKLSK